MNMNTTLPFVDDALALYQEHALALASLRLEEQKLEDERHIVKMRVIARIMASDNPLTGKPHSASSAEAVVNLDAEYGDYLARQRDVVLQKNIMHGKCEAARIRALALANMSAQLAEAA